LIKIGRVKEVDSTLKLSICKKGKSNSEEYHNFKNRIIENKICLWAGSTGSGKSVANFYRTSMFYNLGYTCIRLTEKKLNPFETLAMMLPVKEEYQLNALKKQKQEGMTHDQLKELVKIWHPFVIPRKKTTEGKELISKLYKKKHFPINWFSFPVRMPEETIMAILMGNADLQAVRVCKTIIENLKEKESRA